MCFLVGDVIISFCEIPSLKEIKRDLPLLLLLISPQKLHNYPMPPKACYYAGLELLRKFLFGSKLDI